MTYKFKVPIRERAVHFHWVLGLRSGTDDRRLDGGRGSRFLALRGHDGPRHDAHRRPWAKVEK